MASREREESNHRPQQPLPPSRENLPASRLKPIYLLSISVLFLAISFSFLQTRFFKIQYLKSPLLRKHVGSPQKNPKTPMRKPPYCVLWMAPFLSGGGYSSEAWSYILALHENLNKKEPRFRLAIEQHGDLESLQFWDGLPPEMRSLAVDLYRTECRMNETIVVCHSEPGAWYPPLFETLPCPPNGYGQFRFVIGRTMFETDRVNPHHVSRCNRMDSVWVPTEFHVSTFVQSGVDPSKVVKIVQPVDLKFFDPSKYNPLNLRSTGIRVLGSGSKSLHLEKQFVFLSIFKWEYRKGWDVLLQSYLKEFSGADGVALYLLSNSYHSNSDFSDEIVEFVEDSRLETPAKGWAPIYVIDSHIAQVDLPRLYKAADAFVLPSRGEGWGRPIVEAMAMSLPVIATNWSGPTEYITEENGYPLPVDRMTEVLEGPFAGHLWAEPSVDKLQGLMRHVMSDPVAAKAKGRQARNDMAKRFSPEIVSGVVTDRIQQILDEMD